MDMLGHHEVVLALIVIPVLAFVALAVYVYGADSRIDDVARRRHFNG
jgi:hypothetical protein